MNAVVAGRTYEGRAIDVDAGVSAAAVARAVRGEDVDGVSVSCPSPTPVHDYVGLIPPVDAFDLRGALATTARALGHEAPQREAIEDLRTQLTEFEVDGIDVAAIRRRVAEAGDDEAHLRERVAALRGRVQALREADGETAADAEAELESAITELSEVETERIAAEQSLSRAEARERAARDRRERRLELADRLANLERGARADLAATVYDEFTAAVATLPGDGDAGGEPGEYDGDAVTAALGVARVAPLRAPVVLAADRFDDAATAADRLDAPVVRLPRP
ncbi:hypothetical protein [Salinirarus marinus]|uniref:DUF7856 family protein n=1 Tax=Salinirarus marinus TaxID=3068310 RepID=UPI003C6C8877